MEGLPDPALDYLEWLIEEVEYALDDIVMDISKLEDANQVIQKYTIKKPSQ